MKVKPDTSVPGNRAPRERGLRFLNTGVRRTFVVRHAPTLAYASAGALFSG